MKHYTETEIELYLLNAPEVMDVRNEVESHLAECAGCKEVYEELKSYYADVQDQLKSNEQLLPALRDGVLVRPQRSVGKKYRDQPALREVEIAFPIRAARWLVRHPYVSTGGFAAFAFLGVYMLLVAPATKDRNPVIGKLTGEMLIVQNRYGEVLDEIHVGTATGQSYQIGGNFTKCFDVDGDGINEILWVVLAADNPEGVGIVSCKSIEKNKLLWTKSLRKAIIFPDEDENISDQYDSNTIEVGDFDKDGKPEVYILARNRSLYPGFLEKIDALTGDSLSIYVHSGHLNSMKLADLDGDGFDEILLSGINNALQKGCFIVLDPKSMSGHGPAINEYIPDGYTRAVEKAYILIPKTIVGETTTERENWSNVNWIDIDSVSRTIRVSVNDNLVNDSLTANFNLFFEFDLNVHGYTLASDYEIAARELFKNRTISRLPDSDYFHNEYFNQLRYWDGTDWTTKPTFNLQYVKTLPAL